MSPADVGDGTGDATQRWLDALEGAWLTSTAQAPVAVYLPPDTWEAVRALLPPGPWLSPGAVGAGPVHFPTAEGGIAVYPVVGLDAPLFVDADDGSPHPFTLPDSLTQGAP